MQSIGDAEVRRSAYSTSLIEETTGISRTTLRYYEDAGVISPQRRDGSKYRVYTNAEVGNIIDCTLLKAAGYSVADSAEFVAGERRGCAELLGVCLRGNASQRAWNEAVHTEFQRLRDIYVDGELGRPRLVWGERILFYPNQDVADGRVEGDELQKALFRSAPISSTAEIFDGGLQMDGPLEGRWGRAVQERFLPLLEECVPDFPDLSAYCRPGVGTIEEGPQVVVSFETPLDESGWLDASHELRGALDAFMREKRLTPQVPCLLTDYLPVGDTLYATLRVPVHIEGTLARAMAGRLPRG